LILWGADDPFIPVSHARAAYQAVPGSRLEIFDGVGHFPQSEAPTRFIEVLSDFVDSTPAARLTDTERELRGQR
jgi:pimeloyl-ACP methyl ester carboxylesterase